MERSGKLKIIEMNAYKATYELIDISSDEEEFSERASTPLPRCEIPNYRVVLEVPHSPAEATVGDGEYFDLSLESLESDCKRLELNISYESIDTASLPNAESVPEVQQKEGPADSPESPDESMNSEVFIVEQTNSEESTTSTRILEYLEQVHQEDSGSYFSTPPGTPRKISFRPISPLNDLEEPNINHTTAVHNPGLLSTTFMMRQPGRAVFPTGVALSQPAPGLACGCRRLRIGRGHGCNLRFPRSYFNW